MKELGNMNLTEKQIIYPSPRNPRLKGLTVKEAGIRVLAESIRTVGQLQPIIVRKYDGKFETVDGDRRCIAIFRVLKLGTIKALVYEMDDLEAGRLRIIANIQKEDLSTAEKGKYCRDLFDLTTIQANLNPKEAWQSRLARSKYLAQIASEIGVTVDSILNWIRLWEEYSPEAQAMIAKNKEDLRDGLVPATLAIRVASIARRLDADPNATLKLFTQNRWSAHEAEIINHRIKEEKRLTLDKLPEIVREFRQNYIYRAVDFEAESYRLFLKQAEEDKIRFDDYLSFAVKFALTHKLEFRQFVTNSIAQKQLMRQ